MAESGRKRILEIECAVMSCTVGSEGHGWPSVAGATVAQERRSPTPYAKFAYNTRDSGFWGRGPLFCYLIRSSLNGQRAIRIYYASNLLNFVNL